MRLLIFTVTVCFVAANTTNGHEVTLSETKLDALIARVEALEEIVNKQSATIHAQNEMILKLRDERIGNGSSRVTTPVAFTAYLDNIITNPSAGRPIPFNRVLLNQGNAYNVSSGTFKSPQSGVYLFTFGLESDASNFLVASLFVDEVNQVNSVCIQYQNGGNTALVHLAAGSSVWVGTSGANATIWNSDKLHYSTFSGVFLY